MSRLQDALVAHYKMNDNLATSAVVDSTGTKNGVYTDGVTPVNTSTGSVAGKVNSALDLDTNEWINVGAHGATIKKTIAMWVNPDAVNVTDGIIQLNGSVVAKITNGTVTMAGWTIYIDGEVGTAVTADWHFIAFTNDTGSDADILQIGKDYAFTYFNGIVDNVMLFTEELTPDEIRRLYNNGHGSEILAEAECTRRFNSSRLPTRARFEK